MLVVRARKLVPARPSPCLTLNFCSLCGARVSRLGLGGGIIASLQVDLYNRITSILEPIEEQPCEGKWENPEASCRRLMSM